VFGRLGELLVAGKPLSKNSSGKRNSTIGLMISRPKMRFFTNGMGRCMGTNSIDYVCDLNCPISNKNVVYCCQSCRKARKSFITDANKHLWTADKGFLSKKGCKLSRNNMPSECKTYDCRRYTFKVNRVWADGKWIDTYVTSAKL